MDKKYVYVVTTSKVDTNAWFSNDVKLFGELKDMLDWMEWNDLVFLNKEQIESIQHGREAAIRSKWKGNKENSYTIGKIESKVIN